MAKCLKCGAQFVGRPENCPKCGEPVKYKSGPSPVPAKVVVKKSKVAARKAERANFRVTDEAVEEARIAREKRLAVSKPAPAPRASYVPAKSAQVKPAPVAVRPAPVAPVAKEEAAVAPVAAPVAPGKPFVEKPLRTNRSFIKLFFLSIVTLGIYALVFYCKWGRDLNRIRLYHGDRKRIGFFGAFFLGFITFGITMLVWAIRSVTHPYAYARLEKCQHGSAAFCIVSYLLLSWTIVCPIIVTVQLIRTMNDLCRALNKK